MAEVPSHVEGGVLHEDRVAEPEGHRHDAPSEWRQPVEAGFDVPPHVADLERALRARPEQRQHDRLHGLLPQPPPQESLVPAPPPAPRPPCTPRWIRNSAPPV